MMTTHTRLTPRQMAGQHKDLDEWIATLRECKPITEANVKSLCDKVESA